MSIDVIQLTLVGVILIGSLTIGIRILRPGTRSAYGAAFEWLHLWLGGGIALCLLEAIETISGPLG